MRLRFRAGLLRLDRRRVIVYRPSLTTGEVARAIGSPAFAEVGDRFDAIAYGGRPAEQEDAEAAQARLGGGARGDASCSRRSREGRLALGAVAVVVAVNLVTRGRRRVRSPAPRARARRRSRPRRRASPPGPSSRAAPAARCGALRERPSDDTLPAEGTVVMLDPESFTRGQARALRRFAERGGRVVAGGAEPGDVARRARRRRARPALGRRRRAAARACSCPLPRPAPPRAVRTAEAGVWEAPAARCRWSAGDDGPIVARPGGRRRPDRPARRRVAAPEPAARRGRQRRAGARAGRARPGRPSSRACTATARRPGSRRCPPASAGR